MGNKITRRCSTVDERYTRPQGLYPQRDVDQKKLRRLILDSKLAPCFPGEEETSADCEECPICFLYYPSLNRSKCCSKGVCTECFLQIKSPRAARSTQCPFCKSHNYAVEYRGSKTLEEKGIEAAEEQKFIEAKIRMRKQELLDDEEREQRKEEGRTTPTSPIDEDDPSRLLELPESRSNQEAQQESVTSDMSDRPSSCDDLDSSRVCEEHGSEGSLAPSPAPQESIAPSPPSSQSLSGMDSATSQQQPGPAPPGYTRHRDDEFDFDLEDIMVMEAIWQSIQDQGTRHRYTASEPPRMAPNQLADLSTEFQEDAGVGATSEAQPQVVGSGAREQLHQSGRRAGGLASAIAALAERHAIKGETTPASKQTSNGGSSSEPEPEPESEPEPVDEALAVEADASENRCSGRCDKPEVTVSWESDLHAMAVTLAIESESESVMVSGAEQSGVPMDSSCDDQSSQQAKEGASASACGASYPYDALPVNSPIVAATRCATDADGKVMLPKSFEEQMMLAMALSLADAQSRARLEDSHPRPLGQRIFE